MRKRILVTGGAGFIGSHLCERLLADGNEVIALDNYYSGDKRNVEHLTANPLFRLVRHDVTFPYFEEVDQIYNLACPSAPADYMHDPVMTLKTSLIGAVNMLEVARRMGARILQASSGKVYGKCRRFPNSIAETSARSASEAPTRRESGPPSRFLPPIIISTGSISVSRDCSMSTDRACRSGTDA